MFSDLPEVHDLTSLVIACALDGALCREHLVGSAHTWAAFRYRFTVSVGVGLSESTADFHIYKEQQLYTR